MSVYNHLFGNYITRTFSDIFPTYEDFLNEWLASPYSQVSTNEESINAIDPTYIKLGYWLLIARYADSHIASQNEDLFKYKVFNTFFTHGPTWTKRLEIQNKIRNLTEEEILMGSKVINNQALNPGTEPTTEELTAINAQNTSKRKKSILEGYSTVLSLLKVDVCEEFIDRFKSLFITVVQPNTPLWYITDEGDN